MNLVNDLWIYSADFKKIHECRCRHFKRFHKWLTGQKTTISHRHPAASVWRDVRLFGPHACWVSLMLNLPRVLPTPFRLSQGSRFLADNGVAELLAIARLSLLHDCLRYMWLQRELTEGLVTVLSASGHDIFLTTNRGMFSGNKSFRPKRLDPLHTSHICFTSVIFGAQLNSCW